MNQQRSQYSQTTSKGEGTSGSDCIHTVHHQVHRQRGDRYAMYSRAIWSVCEGSRTLSQYSRVFTFSYIYLQ